jgi:hypothetical protein
MGRVKRLDHSATSHGVVINPVHLSDFVVTIYNMLGYGGETRVTDRLGRLRHIVHGKPVRELF